MRKKLAVKPSDYFEALCLSGEDADRLSQSGQYDEAARAYLALIRRMEKSNFIDSYILSKCVLGLLLNCVLQEDYLSAHEIITSEDDSYYGIGVALLETGDLSENDRIIYFQICALLHALSVDDLEEAAEHVDELCSIVCEWVRAKNPAFLGHAVQNWRQLLIELHGQKLPAKKVKSLQSFYSEKLPRTSKDFKFLSPSKWEDSF
jgi:hypothetical protein